MNNRETPAVTWLYVTGYLHDWLFHEFGGTVKLHGRPVISIAHLKGARDILRMETLEDMMDRTASRWAMSAMLMDCVVLGIDIGPKTMKEKYGVTKEQLQCFVPIECPRMALTPYGMLRPWSRVTCFGHKQAQELVKLLRAAFWQAVADHKEKMIADGNAPETASELVQSFSKDNGVGEVWQEDLRREWQRLAAVRRSKNNC